MIEPHRQQPRRRAPPSIRLRNMQAKQEPNRSQRRGECRRDDRQLEECQTYKMSRRRQTVTSLAVKFNLLLLLAAASAARGEQSDTAGAQQQVAATYMQTQATSSFSPPPATTPSVLKRDLSAKLEPLNGKQPLPPPSGYPNNACQVNDGESVAILEIEESRGSDFSQSTSPAELPIGGPLESSQIELKIESETHKYFQIQDKRLKLTRPLDRDAVLKKNSTQIGQQPISSIYLQLSCVDRRAAAGATHPDKSKKVIIPVLVKVLDLNDNAPRFTQPIYTVQVDELAPIGSVVLDEIFAIDLDSANNGQVEYSLLSGQEASGGGGQAAREVVGSSRLLGAVATTTTATPPPTLSRTTTQLPQTSQRLVQRVPTTTTTSTTTPSSITTTTLASAPTNAPLQLGSAAKPYGLSSGEPLATTARTPVGPSRNQPTINLNSEPILNGPMDESDEEESDEALLAALNNSSDSSRAQTQDSDMLFAGFSFVGRQQPVEGKRRKRRHFEQQQTTATTLADEQQLQRAATKTLVQNLPWTNLMAGDDYFHDLVASERVAAASSERQQFNNNFFDSSEYFSLEMVAQTNRPIIKLKRSLDYETRRIHMLTILASDKAQNKQERLSSSATIVIRVLDGDDQAPAFVLDQIGCATGAPTAPPAAQTTPAAAPQTRPVAKSTRRRDVSVAAAVDQLAQIGERLKGFKVTEENFDFGDAAASAKTANATGGAAANEGESERTGRTNSAGGDDAATDADDEDSGDDLTAQRVQVLPSEPGPATNALDEASGRARRLAGAAVLPAPEQILRSAAAAAAAAAAAQQQASVAQPRAGSASGYYSCLNQRQQYATNQVVGYFSSVMSGESDYLLRIMPQAIKARDRDELNAPIRYSFVNGTPANYSHYFQINPLDASIKQVAPVDRVEVSRFQLWIQAQEQTQNKLSSVAKLTIEVVPTDKSPPVLHPNAYAGFVEENSPLGTRVLVFDEAAEEATSGGEMSTSSSANKTSGKPAATFMQIAVLDSDGGGRRRLERRQQRLPPMSPVQSLQEQTQANSQRTIYEFDTTSDAFKVDRNGYVYVNKSPLDRDAPSQSIHMFQVTARQVGLVSSRSISSPISLNVTLLDLNDNPPVLLNQTQSSQPIQMAANSRGGIQQITQVRASDKDEPQNSKMHFSIRHVSNNGKERFRIDEESGQIEALGKFSTGEQFSLTVQVADELGRSSQAIVDVLVVPGANTGGPQFVVDGNERDNSRGYFVEVNEGVALRAPILHVHAIDPENDPITYSIVSGNLNQDFSINSKTGLLSVANKLDREEISAYNLLVQARDSGGLATIRPIHITVTDSNDQNPVFAQPSYELEVYEGASSVGQVLGRVLATDADANENGRVTYTLTSATYSAGQQQKIASSSAGEQQQQQKTLFSIDEQSGDIRLLEPLDFEETKQYTLLVTARDSGENPRSASASVQVRVLDTQDEAPYFERFHFETRLDENQANARVALVQARDPDSAAQISYLLLSGDSSLFAVDSQTGLVTTLRGLDFEKSRSHTLLVGTQEAMPINLVDWSGKLTEALESGSPIARSPIIRIDIHVNDLNDNVPQFESQSPLPVRIQDSAQLGTVLMQLHADDRDASTPNNQVRYELVQDIEAGDEQSDSINKCGQLFMVDATSGQVSVRADLKRSRHSECHLQVRARDLPQDERNSLSSVAQVTIFIDHLAEISPSSMIGFGDTSFTVELSENTPANSLVKMIPIVNKPSKSAAANFPLNCEIINGNELGKFFVAMDNEKRDCELRTRDNQLDYEQRQRYTLTLRLNTLGFVTTSARSIAQVHVNILDRNDNRPMFRHLSSRYAHLTQSRFLAAIASDSPSETQVAKLRAIDDDSPQANGLVTYELLNEQELEHRFKIDLVDGIVRTCKPVEDLPITRLPVHLKLRARDNPEQQTEALESLAELVVNLIEDRHRIALVLKDTQASRVLDSKEELLSELQERTGLISGLERVESLKLQRNGSLIEPDVSGSDVWFYLVEPGTLRIVPSDDPRLRATLFESRAQGSLLDVLANLGFPQARLRLPYSINAAAERASRSAASSLLLGAIRVGGDSSERLAPLLILVAIFIAITSAIVVVYQCGSAAALSSQSAAFSSAAASSLPFGQLGQFASGAALGEKLFFAAPPPPPSSQGHQYQSSQRGSTANSLQDAYAIRSAFNTMTSQPPANLTGGQPDGSAAIGGHFLGSKEYETQMLKMSVLFEDSHSLDEQNLGEQQVNKKPIS